ncbi:MAG TPA: SprT family zinc-dependent metalloprotease [Bacteroidales bacterium]|nr:SprT family zinc-dependent metalloprotease [Bacteroidales bacterium]
MLKYEKAGKIEDIEFKVIYSRRRTLGISVLPDSSVIVRVPYLTSSNTINRVVSSKADWIIKHRDSYREKGKSRLSRSYENGQTHLFHGNESVLKIEQSGRSYIRFYDSTIELGLRNTDDAKAVKRLLYNGYKKEASALFPEMLNKALTKYDKQMFKPSGLIIRTMRRRWGSCSNRGIITLSTELIKLPDHCIEYVIVHELCHLKHHNHGAGYYKLLSELFPEWKKVKNDMKKYIIN